MQKWSISLVILCSFAVVSMLGCGGTDQGTFFTTNAIKVVDGDGDALSNATVVVTSTAPTTNPLVGG